MTYLVTKSPISQAAIPVIILSGLLGSGKTTFLSQLLQYKQNQAVNERWTILINDFGGLNLDAIMLAAHNIKVIPLGGGCICCTAEPLFSQQLLALSQSKPPDRIIIEPSGLANPTMIIRAIRHCNQYYTDPKYQLHHVITLIDATQFNPDHYHASALLRDMLSLADQIMISKTDLISDMALNNQQAWLDEYLQPSKPIHNRLSDHLFNSLLQPTRPKLKFQLLTKAEGPQLGTQLEPFISKLPAIITAEQKCGDISLISWQGQVKQLWSRSALKTMMLRPPAGLLRMKALLRTGQNWQAVQWSPSGLTFQEQAWYLDNRLEILVNWPHNIFSDALKAFEEKLSNCIQVRDLN